MFTGIIKAIGKVLRAERKGKLLQLTIECPLSHTFKIDESISHNGVCLTIIAKNNKTHTVQVIPETLSKTNLGILKPGDLVNIEPSLKIGEMLSGHLVQGHVDGCCKVRKIKLQEGTTDIWLSINRSDAPLIIPRGSICINGISLTVAEIKKSRFKISIIPYTFDNTNLNTLKKDDVVNVEYDIIGKYLLRWNKLKHCN
ncbi:MAG: riboflavin synthase [Saprospiraceae bacterium]